MRFMLSEYPQPKGTASVGEAAGDVPEPDWPPTLSEILRWLRRPSEWRGGCLMEIAVFTSDRATENRG